MKKFADFIVSKKKLIIVIALLLLIPSILGFIKTRTNYDILTYLPSDIETLKGQNILTDDFHLGSFSITIVENTSDYELEKLEEEIRKIDYVGEVVSINDFTGTTIPIEMLPKRMLDKVAKNDSKLILITFKTGNSDDQTTEAVDTISELSQNIEVGGMSSMVHDIRKLFESETLIYVTVAVICCLIILLLFLDSYVVPFILLANIGISILFNMGSNIIFGDISYITKAIAAVLQLGVTTDFSIFLYHKYQYFKTKCANNDEAMSKAICETMVSVVGSSLTTIAGFLALCSMKLTLGTDIGLVMAKGVVFGVITVLTLYPVLLLVFDKLITKTKHKAFTPKFSFIPPVVKKCFISIFIVFLLLIVPAYIAQKKTQVYYKLDTSIPDDYSYTIATKKLKEEYGMISQELIILNNSIENYEINNMIDEIEKLDGIDNVLSSSVFSKYGFNESILPSRIRNLLLTDKYKLVLVNSKYEIATDELGKQIDSLNEIVKKYDKEAIVAGEGPLTNDLVGITAIDFVNVSYVSIIVIFVIMFFVLKSISLPVLLVSAIEFAIFINMGVPYITGTSIPFVSSIVIGTIQLGATIDYAILLTTKYLDERKLGKDKMKSVENALKSSVQSIFVSAMCFFGATGAVYVVSSNDMISSLCLLMARGAIISMIVVMFIVPSILLVFDKLIIKTTLGFKKGSKKNEK